MQKHNKQEKAENGSFKQKNNEAVPKVTSLGSIKKIKVTYQQDQKEIFEKKKFMSTFNLLTWDVNKLQFSFKLRK